MPQYTVAIKIPNAGNREFTYSVKLTDSYEDYPEDYFKIKENRTMLSQTIQNQSGRQVSESQLKKIINDWVKEIKENRRNVTITLDLPPEGIPTPNQTPVSTIRPPVASTIPVSNPAPKPKPRNPGIGNTRTATPPSSTTPVANNSPTGAVPPSASASNSTTPPQQNTTPSEEKTEEPKPSIETAKNEPDF